MENKAHAAVAIAFLVIFSLGAALIYYWLHMGPAETRIYDIVSEHAVGGLQPEAPVKFKGIRVGSVKNIHFDPKNPTQVIVRISVQKKAYITHATYAQLGSQGITGLTYVKLELAKDESRKPLSTDNKNPARLPMRKGLMQSLEDAGTEDLKTIGTVLNRVSSVLDQDNREHLAATLAQLDQATRRVTELEKSLAPAVKAMPEIVRQAHSLLNDTRDLEKTIGQLAQQARGPVRDIGGAAESVEKFGKSADTAARGIDEELMPRIEALVKHMNQTVNRIDQLSRELKNQPQSVIFGAPPSQPGPGEKGFTPPPAGQGGHE